MITEDIFKSVLFEPAATGADGLYIASGYARPAMVDYHLEKIKDYNIKITLLIGMCQREGLYSGHHKAFQELSKTYSEFKCYYLANPPPMHSKVYVWTKSESPILAFTGSANYSQTAFSPYRREAMTQCDANEAYIYIKTLINDAIECTKPSVGSRIKLLDEISYTRTERITTPSTIGIVPAPAKSLIPFSSSIQISLLDKKGLLPAISGLNWGQRPSRERNQAYIKLPASIYNSDFFPERKIRFSVITDDGKVFTCSRAQENGKAIHTPQNNSLIGMYFRERMGLPSGSPVTKNDLLKYGRTNIDFYKLDEETFYLDFSV